MTDPSVTIEPLHQDHGTTPGPEIVPSRLPRIDVPCYRRSDIDRVRGDAPSAVGEAVP